MRANSLLLLVAVILTSQAERRFQQGTTTVTRRHGKEPRDIIDVPPVRDKDADYIVKILPYDGLPIVVLYREGILEDTATIVHGGSEFTFRIDKTSHTDTIRFRIS